MYLCPGRPLGNQGLCLYIVSPVVCVLACSSHALKWELYVQDRKCVHPFCVYKALPHPHGVLHRGGGCYSFIICLFSWLHVPSLTPSCIISHSGLLSLHLMVFLFSSTAAKVQQWMFYGLFVKATPLLSPVSSLFPSPRGIVGVRLFPSRPLDCCMFYKQWLCNACASIDAELSISLLFLVFHLKRQISTSTCSHYEHEHIYTKCHFFSPHTEARHTYSRVAANCSV